jgi:hypothetical protein
VLNASVAPKMSTPPGSPRNEGIFRIGLGLGLGLGLGVRG